MICWLFTREKNKNPTDTIKNLNANAANGSLLSIKGLVVIKADDQSIMNINGNTRTIIFYKPYLVKSYNI